MMLEFREHLAVYLEVINKNITFILWFKVSDWQPI